MYKRPHLNEFLSRVSKLGVVSVFTANKAEYANPILDKLDPQNVYFQNRFHVNSCVPASDGSVIKDMSVIQSLIEEVPANEPSSWWLSRLISPSPPLVSILNSEI